MDLTKKHCFPCKKGILAFSREKVKKYAKEIRGWKLAGKKIYKEFKFKDFRGSLNFVKKVARIADKENHHPDIYIFYNIVELEIWTHAVRGLTENDFILAAKINKVKTHKLPKKPKSR